VVLALLLPAPAFAGDGSFPDSLATTANVGPQSIAVAVGDFNNDGIQDLASVSTMPTPTAQVRFGAGDGTFSGSSSLATGAGPVAIAVGDLNGDGNEDIVTANNGGHDVTAGIGDGHGAFSVHTNGLPAGPAATSVAIGDFNADGEADLAVSTNAPDAVDILIGAGNGNFNLATGSPHASGGTSANRVAVEDFNNDGSDDVAVVNGENGASPGSVAILIGAGNGQLSAPTLFSAERSPRSIAIGDFNADGNQDFAVANYSSGSLTIRLGAGNGSFPTTASFGVGGAQAVAVGDFNSDGRDDLAVLAATGSVSVRLGDGAGGFVQVAPGSPFSATNQGGAMTVGDFDADGSDDLAVSNFATVAVRRGGGPAPLAGNLLANGGFEGPGAVQTYNAAALPAIPSWQATGNITYAGYGLATNHFFPDRFDALRVDGGENYLYTGLGADASASQTVDVSGSAGSIDAGLASVTLSADLGGSSIFQDRMKATATFLDSAGGALGSFEIGPVTVADRHNLSVLLPRSATSAAPVGTRAITVALAARDDDNNYNGASADNVKLTMSAPAPPDTNPPDRTAPETIKGKGPKKRSTHRKAKFRFSSEAGATFECKLDNKQFASCTSPKKLKHVKPGKHQFEVRATDAAGNIDPTPAKWRWRVVKKHR
jgi:FG-GAP-like repeat